MTDLVSRKAVLDTLDEMDKALDTDRTIENYKGLLIECYKDLIPVISEQMNIEAKNITLEEFYKLSLEDVNYSGILFVFDYDFLKDVKQKISEWEINKMWRLDQVEKDQMFYVENCDLQSVDGAYYFFRLINSGNIKEIYYLQVDL